MLSAKKCINCVIDYSPAWAGVVLEMACVCVCVCVEGGGGCCVLYVFGVDISNLSNLLFMLEMLRCESDGTEE